MSSLRKAIIYKNDIRAGVLIEQEDEFIFTYEKSYIESGRTPISLTLPITPNPYISKSLFPFFDGLIPEGWLLDIALTKFKLDYKDRFGLLVRFCKDCIGAVSIIDASEEDQV